MADGPFGFGAKDVGRIITSVHTTENLPEYSTHKRGRYPLAGGGGENIIGIVIVSVDDSDPDDITAVCLVTTPCESVPEEDEDGQIVVYDQMMGCLLNMASPAELVGATGWCVRKAMRFDPYCEKKYQLGDLCCL